MTSSTKRMLVSRRLLRSEARDLTSICCEGFESDDAPIADESFARFLDLEDSLAYIASIDSQPVGGTALFRDRKRLSIGLLALRMCSEHRADTAQPLIKSSLPFFKTTSIREVDALVADDNAEGRPLPFPFGYELPHWTASILLGLGFKDAGKMYSCLIVDAQCISQKPQAPKLQEDVTIDDFRQLLWKNRKKSGANCVQPGAALALSHRMGSLHKVTSASGMRAMFTFAEWNKTAKIDCIQVEEESMLENEVAIALVGMIRDRGLTSVLMPLLGSGQRCVANVLADLLGSDTIFRTQQLMRKPL